jgi:hypothetical protein
MVGLSCYVLLRRMIYCLARGCCCLLYNHATRHASRLVIIAGRRGLLRHSQRSNMGKPIRPSFSMHSLRSVAAGSAQTQPANTSLTRQSGRPPETSGRAYVLASHPYAAVQDKKSHAPMLAGRTVDDRPRIMALQAYRFS